jgi:hypothetical protein
MPKSGFSANSQAKVCANAVRGALTGSRVFPAKFANTCWSLIDTDDGVKVGATYEASDDCSAAISRRVMEADPMNIVHCPYSIFVAEMDGEVMIGHRAYPDGPMQEVEAMLD